MVYASRTKKNVCRLTSSYWIRLLGDPLNSKMDRTQPIDDYQGSLDQSYGSFAHNSQVESLKEKGSMRASPLISQNAMMDSLNHLTTCTKKEPQGLWFALKISV